MSLRFRILEKLRLVDFRNYTTLVTVLSPHITIITGNNGQGKSNLLEAIATTTLTKSPRTSNQGILIREGASAAAVDCEFKDNDNESTILSLRLQKTDTTHTKKILKVDGGEKKAQEILGLVPTTVFWPDDIAIIKGSPETRRNFLDTLLSQLFPASHQTQFNTYYHLLEQRNALLGTFKTQKGNQEILDIYTLQLAEAGAFVQMARHSLIEQLAPLIKESLIDITGQKDYPEIHYKPSGNQSSSMSDPLDATIGLLDALQSTQNEDKFRGLTSVGPHRDDFDLRINGASAKTHASQGQQRTLLLAIKLAELRHLTKITNITPLLLLDDVLSELDNQRREAFLHLAQQDLQAQTVITSADPLLLPGKEILRLQVENARLHTYKPEK